MKKNLILSLLLLIFSFNVFSQTGELKGIVYDKETGERLSFVNVFLQGTQLFSVSDYNGYYSINKIPKGHYTLMVSSYMGYDTFKVAVDVQNKIIKKDIHLINKGIEMSEIEVNDKKTEQQTKVTIGKVKIKPKEVYKIPAMGAEADFVQYMQVLPGVVFTGDQGGQIYIRGGTPIQNKVLLDGMTIYNPFHSIGLFSVFDIDIIRDIDVYAGGFEAKYGDRISAVMDIRTRSGNKKRIAGKIGTSPFMSKVLLEGPIKKWKEGQGSSSFLFTARNSYLDKTAPILYEYADSNGLPYSFSDFYGKITFNASEGSKFDVFGFNFQDKSKYQNINTYEWNSSGLGMHISLIPTMSRAIVDGNLSYSNYKIVQKEADQRPRESSIGGYDVSMNFSYFMDKDLFKYGFELSGFKTDFRYYNSTQNLISQTENTTNLGAFFSYKKIFANFILYPSIRLQYYASLQEFNFEPRLRAKYNITDFLRVKIAFGKYSQNFLSATSDRDVVNLFYGFLSGPDNIPKTFHGKSIDSRLQKSTHYIGGVELDFNDYSSLNVEGYYKFANQLTNLNRNKIFDNSIEFKNEPSYLKDDFIIERERAYGIDFLYKYEKERLYLWLVYSYSFVEREDQHIFYNPNWDRRHNVNMLLTYTLCKDKSFEISVRYNYGSGFPFTQTQGFYEFIDFQDGVSTDYTRKNGELGIIYGELNKGRLPYYSRLDLSLKKRFQLSKNSTLEITGSVINLLNDKNIFYFDRVRHNKINQLPIIPSIGVSFTF